MSVGREVQRGQRRRGEVPSVAIAGYTNAGKSSLLNRLTGAHVLVDNSLFATLDPAVRKARTPLGWPYTLTDTVGFVRHLPHQLVDAFRSTLEEVADADLILHVVDGSDADPRAQLAAVREVLGQVGASERARARRHQQGRRGHLDRAGGAAAGRAATRWWCRRGPARASTSCSPSWTSGCRASSAR